MAVVVFKSGMDGAGPDSISRFAPAMMDIRKRVWHCAKTEKYEALLRFHAFAIKADPEGIR
jgi:hypothetical protein